jgi:hypothetical protein
LTSAPGLATSPVPENGSARRSKGSATRKISARELDLPRWRPPKAVKHPTGKPLAIPNADCVNRA